jgi:acyl-CoA thioesterase
VSAFARATAVEALGAGAWRAACDPAWRTQLGPNGGYLAAVILRAMMAELDDPARQARSLTCHYLRPPGAGELRLDVTVERSGRSLSTITARLSQDGALCVLAVGAFAVDFVGAMDYADAPPPVPAPGEVERLPPVDVVPMTQHFEMRPTIGAPLYAGAPESASGGWLRFVEPQPLDAPALAMFSDAWWPSPLPRLTRPVTAPTIDLTVHFRAPAAAAAIAEEPVLAVFRSSTAADGFFEEDGELWSADGVLLAHSRQLALLVDGAR